MSRRDDRSWFLIDESAGIKPHSISLTSISVNSVLGKYEKEAKAGGTNHDVLVWQLIVLRNFIESWLPDNGMVIMKASLETDEN